MDDDIVLVSIREALLHEPSLIIVEGGYPAKGFGDVGSRFCDVRNQCHSNVVSELIKLVKTYNKERYGKAVF